MNIKIHLAAALLTAAFAVPALAQNAQPDPACMLKNSDGTTQIDKAKCPDGMKPSTTEMGTKTNPPADTDVTTGSTSPVNDVFLPSTALSGGKLVAASDFIGKRVYSNANEDIGEVNDVLLSEDGSVRAVILGVGGFLGIGEKNVAIQMKAVQMMTPSDGSTPKLMVNATKEQLTAANAYDRTTRNYAN